MQRGILRFLSVSLPKVLGGLATVGLNLFLMRWLRAEDLAVFSICLAAILLVDAIAGSALDMATIKLGSASGFLPSVTGEEVQRHAIYIKCIVAAIALGVVVLAKPWLWMALTHRLQGGDILYSTCTAAAGLLLVRSAQVQMQLEHRFVAYGLMDLLHLLLRFGGLGFFVWLGSITPERVLFCYAVAPLAVTALWLAYSGRKLFASLAIRQDVLRLLLTNVNWLLITFSLSAVISRMDLFLVSRWSGLSEAGIFAGGLAFAMIPQMLGLYMSVLVGPKIMPKLADGSFLPYFQTVQKWILLLALGCFAAFSLLWQPVSSLLLPEKYIRSSEVIRALMPGALAGMVTFPLTLSFVLFIRPRFLFIVDCIAFPVLLPVYFYAIHTFGAVGAAWTTTGAALTRALIAQVMAWRWAQSYSTPEIHVDPRPRFADA